MRRDKPLAGQTTLGLTPECLVPADLKKQLPNSLSREILIYKTVNIYPPLWGVSGLTSWEILNRGQFAEAPFCPIDQKGVRPQERTSNHPHLWVAHPPHPGLRSRSEIRACRRRNNDA